MVEQLLGDLERRRRVRRPVARRQHLLSTGGYASRQHLSSRTPASSPSSAPAAPSQARDQRLEEPHSILHHARRPAARRQHRRTAQAGPHPPQRLAKIGIAVQAPQRNSDMALSPGSASRSKRRNATRIWHCRQHRHRGASAGIDRTFALGALRSVAGRYAGPCSRSKPARLPSSESPTRIRGRPSAISSVQAASRAAYRQHAQDHEKIRT